MIQNTSTIKILYLQGSTVKTYKDVEVSADCIYRNELEGEECVELKWESHEYSRIPIGSYIYFDNRVFYLTEPHEPSRRLEDTFTYTPIFYAEPFHWRKAMACVYEYSVQPTIVIQNNTISVSVAGGSNITSRELDWSFTGNLPDALSMVLQAISNETGAANWTAAWVSEVADKLIEIQGQGLSVYDMLSQIAEQCGKEYYFDYSGNNPVIHIGTLEKEVSGDHTVEVDGRHRVLLNIGEDVNNPQVSSDAEDYFTRFYFFGSTRNIEQPNTITKSAAVNRRLPLNPSPISGSSMKSYPQGFIDINVSASSYDEDGIYQPSGGKAYSKSVFFDDIYPHADLVIHNVRKLYIKVEDDAGEWTGEYMPIFYVQIYDGQTGTEFAFNNSTYDKDTNPTGHLVPNLKPSIAFRSGYLQGLEYELIYREGTQLKPYTAKGYRKVQVGSSWTYEEFTMSISYNTFEIVYDTNSNPRLPNDTICPRGYEQNVYDGDECTLFNIHMPATYIQNAQEELEEKALEYIADLNVDKSTYTLEANPVKFDTIAVFKPDALQVGTLVKMVYPNGEYVLTRVIAVERHIDLNADCKLTLGYKTTQGTLTTLREVIEDTTANVETVVKNEKKNKSQIEGLRNGYRVQKETLDSVFDTDGYFDTDNIRPLSIDTSMLSVGVKSQQFTLSGITFSIAPFASGNGTLVWSSGKMSHFTIDESGVKEWSFNSGTHNLTSSPASQTDTGVWYIYAQCNKTSTTGAIYLSHEQKMFDSDSDYWYFLVGIITSRMQNPDNTSYYIRYINMTYGSTTITGRQVTTGRIQSADGTTFIDLDEAKIGGNIVFEGTGGSEIGIDQYINDTVDDAVSEIEIGGRNYASTANVLAQTTQFVLNSYVYRVTAGNGAGLKIPETVFNVNEFYVLSYKFKKISGTLTYIGGHQAGFTCNKFVVDGTVSSRTYSQGQAMTDDTNTHTVEVYLKFNASSTDNKLYIQPNRGGYIGANTSVFDIWDIMLEKGTVATDWTPAPEDVPYDELVRNLNATCESASNAATKVIVCPELTPEMLDDSNLRIKVKFTNAAAKFTSGGQTVTMKLNFRNSSNSSNIIPQGASSADVYLTFNGADAYDEPQNTYYFPYWNAGQEAVFTLDTSRSNSSNKRLKFVDEEGFVTTSSLYKAYKGTTQILGGLLITETVIAGKGSSQSGMNGTQVNDVAFWAGGDIGAAKNFNTAVVIKRNGDAKFGNIKINGSGSGDLVMYDGTTKRLEIKNNNVSTASRGVVYNSNNGGNTGATNSGTNRNNVTMSTTETTVDIFALAYMQPNPTGNFNFDVNLTIGTITVEVTTAMSEGYGYAELNIDFYNGKSWETIYTKELNATRVDKDTDSYSGSLQYSNVSYAQIGLRARYKRPSGCEARFTISSSAWYYYQDLNKICTQFGNNGMAIYLGAANQFIVSTANEQTLKTIIKGDTDIPGVLWAGKIALAGGVDSVDYNCVNHTVAGQRSATGTYKLALSGFPSNVTVLPTIVNTDTSDIKGCTANVQSISNGVVTIRTFKDNTLTNFAMHVVIFGTN